MQNRDPETGRYLNEDEIPRRPDQVVKDKINSKVQEGKDRVKGKVNEGLEKGFEKLKTAKRAIKEEVFRREEDGDHRTINPFEKTIERVKRVHNKIWGDRRMWTKEEVAAADAKLKGEKPGAQAKDGTAKKKKKKMSKEDLSFMPNGYEAPAEDSEPEEEVFSGPFSVRRRFQQAKDKVKSDVNFVMNGFIDEKRKKELGYEDDRAEDEEEMNFLWNVDQDALKDDYIEKVQKNRKQVFEDL